GRSGTFVLDSPPLGGHRSPPVPPGSVDLASGGPDPRLLPDLGRYLVHEGPSSSYDDPPMLDALETAGRAWLARQGTDAARLIATSGALDAIERVLAAHLRPGDAVAVERPGWSAVSDLVRALGLRPVEVDIDDRGVLPAALEAALPTIDAIVITPRAQNPVGAALDEERQGRLDELLGGRPDILTIVDDHAGLIAGSPLCPLGVGGRRWALVQSMAKTLGPDLRLALVTGDDLTLDRVSGRFGLGPGWVSRILQQTVASLLADDGVENLLLAAESEYTRRRQALVEALAEAGTVDATGRSGLNVWVPVHSEEAAVAAAATAGFVIRGGAAFGAVRPSVRITVSNLDTNDIPRLVSALGTTERPGRRLV
ncbi:MAG TPA: aminotransferase class I/II-fold pyridoxal phosphate-dependent enzyme, partial [Acidimicrobiia bacterium]|nr:aminotransferase class I/II-fold pyridoxal phosphate-dependent enzyme [Acidimicrobiia bacterium]